MNASGVKCSCAIAQVLFTGNVFCKHIIFSDLVCFGLVVWCGVVRVVVMTPFEHTVTGVAVADSLPLCG